MINRIVILGHTGFIGSHLEKYFSNNYPTIEIIGQSLPSIDLAEDASLLKNYFNANTAVIMCAAVKKQLGSTITTCQKNIAMVANLCTMLEQSPVERLIYFSSAAVYGEQRQNLNITEDTSINPSSYYGIAKTTGESLLQKAMSKGLVIVRPPQIYGPGDIPCYGPVGFLHTVLNKEPIILWGDGTEKREFIFVDDVVALVEKLLFSDYKGVLNIASGKSYSYQEILEVIRKMTGLSLQVRSQERTNEKVDHYFDNNTLMQQFPAFQFTSLSKGVQKMISTSQEEGRK